MHSQNLQALGAELGTGGIDIPNWSIPSLHLHSGIDTVTIHPINEQHKHICVIWEDADALCSRICSQEDVWYHSDISFIMFEDAIAVTLNSHIATKAVCAQHIWQY